MSYYFASVLTNFRFHLILHCFWIFSILFGYYWNTVFYLVGILFSFLSSPLFCKRCVYVFDFCILNWVFPGPWEFLWRAESCIYFVCVCLRCVECRAGTSLFGHSGGVDSETVRIFFSLWLCSGGYGTVEMVRGVVRFSSAFFSLLSVFLVVGCLR